MRRRHSREQEILTSLGGTGSISLFDHLLSGANVDGSGSRTHASRCAYTDIFSPMDDILSSKSNPLVPQRGVVDSKGRGESADLVTRIGPERRPIARTAYITNLMEETFFGSLSRGTGKVMREKRQ